MKTLSLGLVFILLFSPAALASDMTGGHVSLRGGEADEAISVESLFAGRLLRSRWSLAMTNGRFLEVP